MKGYFFNAKKGYAIILIVFLYAASPALAFEHKDFPVKFVEYSKESLSLARKENKPVFILFSAQWCYWCKVFAEKTLSEKSVYTYLNKHYINIFVDADVRSDLYAGFHGRGWPYIVFLKPDGSVYYKYSGTLYADAFLDIIKNVRNGITTGKAIEAGKEGPFRYLPPKKIDTEKIRLLKEAYIRTALENFDKEEYGLGKGEKYILPEAFFYMISLKDKKRADEAFDYVYNTLERAAANIYDTVEGGFFRYAEERGWQTPHYEKLTDLNAGTVLLLHNLNAARPSPDFKKAADKTASYIMSKLFDSKNGAFLSYQSADESYYLLDADNRKKRAEPLIGEKIFIDRLSVSLYYMLESLKYFQNTEYEKKVRQSLKFLSKMAAQRTVYHYYSTTEKRWLNKGSLSDHAYLANGFMKAFSILNEPEYLHLSNMIIKEAQKRFYDKDKGIFIERVDGKAIDLEYQLELNGIIALTLLSIPENKRDEGQTRIIKDIITYFSNINDLFEERLWGADGWRFMERYVPYLKAADIYFSLN
jgi:hypothetical protein